MTYRSKWLDWEPTSDLESVSDAHQADKTDRTFAAETSVSFVSSFANERRAISAAIMRLRQAGVSFGVAGDGLTFVEPTEVCGETRAAVGLLRRHGTAAVRLLEALESIRASGVRLPLDQDGQRVIALPRSQDSSALRQALGALGYTLPVVLSD